MGRKRHLSVDTVGLVLKTFVTEANYHDGMVTSWLVSGVAETCPRLAKIWDDKVYRGTFVDEAEALGIDIEIVCGEPNQVGFQVQARRWVVERTFA